MRRFRVSCDQVGEDELRVLLVHSRTAHAADALPDDAPGGDVLRHFVVAEVR